MQVKVAIPNKGRLSDDAVDLLRRAGLRLETLGERALMAPARNGEFMVLFLRAQDIPEFVQDGVADVGITGLDIIEEEQRAVERLVDLRFGSCELALAVQDDAKVTRPEDLPPGSRVATSFPNLTKRFFQKMGKEMRIIEVSGAAEITPHIGVADCIVDLVSTGSTLKMNHMRAVATILRSTAHAIANPESLAGPKGAKVRELVFALESVVAARGRRYLMANVPRARLDDVRGILPGVSGPTIMEIAGHEELVAAHAVVPESDVYEVMNRLKAIGATGILVLPIERLYG